MYSTSEDVFVWLGYKGTVTTDGGSTDIFDARGKTIRREVSKGELSNWRQVIKQGGNATTSLVGKDVKIKQIPFSIYAAETGGIHTIWEFTGFPELELIPGDPSLLNTTVAVNQAKMRFLAKLRENPFEGSTFMAELRETLRMIRNPALALRRGIDQHLLRVKRDLVRRKLWNKPTGKLYGTGPKGRAYYARLRRERRKIIAESWLEAVFGWNPLLSDIDDAMKALAYWNEENHKRGKSIFAKSDVVDLGSTTVVGGPSSKNGLLIAWSKVYRDSSESKIYGKLRVSPYNSVSGWKHFGLHWQNVLPTIWEIIPWSFVIDYFTNIGDIVQAYSTFVGELAWCSQTTHAYSNCEVLGCYVIGTNPGWTPLKFGTGPTGCSSLIERRYVSRQELAPADLIPKFVFDTGLSFKQFLNLHALKQLSLSKTYRITA